MSNIIMYTKPSCVQCTATYKAFAKLGICVEMIDITLDNAAREYVVGLGYQQAPVIVAGDKHWSGFRPDKIKEFATW